MRRRLEHSVVVFSANEGHWGGKASLEVRSGTLESQPSGFRVWRGLGNGVALGTRGLTWDPWGCWAPPPKGGEGRLRT